MRNCRAGMCSAAQSATGVLDGDDIVDGVAHDVGIEVFRTRYVCVAAYGAKHAVAPLAVSDTG